MADREPRMKLAKRTEEAIAGQIEAHGRAEFLNPYICLVCTNHTFGPAVVIAAACQHHFHPPCINGALERVKDKCPCRAPLTPGKERVSDAMRTHKQMMDSLPVQCPQGCGKVFAFELLDGHVRKADGCPLTPFRCGNEGCEVVFLRRDTAEHRAGCPHRLVPCRLCAALIKHSLLQEHEAEQCPRRTLRCTHCERDYVCCEKEEHLRGCTGVAFVKDIMELKGMIAQLRDENARQQEMITDLQRSCTVPGPDCLIVRGTGIAAYNGEYVKRPEVRNGAAVWGKGDCRIYKTSLGHWGMSTEAGGPQRDRGDYRLTSQPASPVGGTGWEYNPHDYNLTRVDSWERRPNISVTAA